jgi:NAD(P)H-hydrate epimerase
VALSKKYQATVVLKGSGTMILGKKTPIMICPFGNPGMATPGMGDVLSGLIAGCMAQIPVPTEAASLAICLHAMAADRVMKKNPAMIVRPKKLIEELQNHMKDLLSFAP